MLWTLCFDESRLIGGDDCADPESSSPFCSKEAGRHLVFALLVTVISLFPRSNDAEGDARDQSKALEVGVMLEAGAIDSSTVDVGAFAVVIHGQGERHPVSGEWETLATARGYIQGVDAERLDLALDGDKGKEQIALNRIQTLVLIGSPLLESTDRDNAMSTIPAEAATIVDSLPGSAVRDRMHPASGPISRLADKFGIGPFDGYGDRFGTKCGMSAFVGTLSAATGFVLMPGSRCSDGNQDEIFCFGGPPARAAQIGILVGTAFGATIADPYTKFTYIYALAGSGMALQVCRKLFPNLDSQNSGVALPMYLGFPAFMAALGSEGMRGFHRESRFSFSLKPDLRGSLSAVVRLGF